MDLEDICAFLLIQSVENKLSLEYYNKILFPVLEFSGIHHEMYETNSSIFDTFFEKLNNDEVKFTDFIVVGGDGLF